MPRPRAPPSQTRGPFRIAEAERERKRVTPRLAGISAPVQTTAVSAVNPSSKAADAGRPPPYSKGQDDSPESSSAPDGCPSCLLSGAYYAAPRPSGVPASAYQLRRSGPDPSVLPPCSPPAVVAKLHAAGTHTMNHAAAVRRLLVVAVLLSLAVLLSGPTLASSDQYAAGGHSATRHATSRGTRSSSRRIGGAIEVWTEPGLHAGKGSRDVALTWGPTRLSFRHHLAAHGWTQILVTWDAGNVRLALNGTVVEEDHLGAPAYAAAAHRVVLTRDRRTERRRTSHAPLDDAAIARRFDRAARRHHLRLRPSRRAPRPTATRRAVARAAAAPVNTVLPAITGTAKDGQTLTSTTGTWSGSPTSYARAWQRCDASGANCVAISGATATTYVLTSTDVGSTIRVKITATASGGSGTATSNQTAAVTAIAPANTALPAITGTAKDGQTLTSTTGTWSGSTPTYARQWKRCDSAGANCAAIPGATGTTYALTPADIGGKIVVAVTATNAAGSATATSSATAAVTAAAPANTAVPAITGTAKEGQLLTSSTGTWTGSATIAYTYQWQSCVSSTCTAISGATGSTYRVTAAEVGKTIKSVVTATNAAGNASATSAATATVTTGAPVNTAVPTVTGTLTDGQTLTAANGTWAGTATITYTRQWKRCDSSGANCTAISGATGMTYTLTSSDVNARIVVAVTATNGVGNATATSDATGLVAGIAPTPSTAPTISGTPTDGQTLSSTTGTWAGSTPITYARQWKRCDGSGDGCTAIFGATGTSYVVASADVGGTIRLTVTASNAAGSFGYTTAPTAAVSGLTPSNTAAPVISGTAKDGQTLTVSSGTWAGTTPLTYAYVWQRCDSSGANCNPIAGATATSYTLGTDDIGAKVKVAVTATNSLGSATATTTATAVVTAVAPAVASGAALTGTAKEGQVLTLSNGTWTGSSPITYTYAWQSCAGTSCSAITGVTGTTYRLVAGDVGKTIKATVTATNVAGNASSTTAVTATVTTGAPIGVVVPAVSGTTIDGQVLTATNGTWAGTATITYTRQWKRCDATGGSCAAISGATGASYTLTPADVATTLRVTVTATNGVGSTSADSAATTAITAGAPANTALPTITGTADAGQTLTSTTGTWTGTQPITYTRQWKRCTAGGSCTPVAGASGTTYAVTTADAGYRLVVAVTASNSGGSTGVQSAPTAAVPGEAPANATLPAISGTAADGQTLTATTGTWSGTVPMTMSYQWRRCDAAGSSCTPTSGATSATYIATSADVGKTIKVTVTASNGVGSASADSAVTAMVTGTPPVETTVPSITGTLLAGRVLTAHVGTWTGSAPLFYTLQWQRCNASGAVCTPIPGAARSTYQLTAEDIGATVLLAVTASNPMASVAATSAATGVIGGAAPANTQLPAIDGVTAEGHMLTADLGIWSGTTPLYNSRQWERCDADGDDCTSIDGATGVNYWPSADDLNSTLRVVVTTWNAVGQASVVSPASLPVVASLPSLVGDPPTLEADDLSEGRWIYVPDQGNWEGDQPIDVVVQWSRCNTSGSACVPIETNNGEWFLVAADVGRTLKAVVHATNDLGSTDYVLPVSGVVQPGRPIAGGSPSITGIPREGQTLSAIGTIYDGTRPISQRLQWERCGPTACTAIAGAASTTYSLTAADVGFTMGVKDTGTNAYGSVTVEGKMDQAVMPNVPVETADPTISGTARDGATLTAGPGTWTSAATPTYSYVWKRCTAAGLLCVPIPQATLDHYQPTSDDVGSAIRVRVTATNASGSGTGLSAATAAVVSSTPQNVGAPSVLGETSDTQTLSVDTGTWTGTKPLTKTYRWDRCDAGGASCVAVSGATADHYILSAADVGATVRVAVTAANANGNATATSAVSAPVTALKPRTSGAAVIHGRPITGETLTLAAPAWEGSAPLTHAYAWQRCDADGSGCATVAGATTKTYVLTTADAGHRLAATETVTNAAGSVTATAPPTPEVGTAALAALALGFDDAHGTVAQDASPNDADALLDGTRWSSGRHGGGLSFDGESDSASVPSVTALDGAALSVEAWVRVRESNQQQIVAQRSAGGHTVTLLAANADGRVAVSVDSVELNGPALAQGWTHLAASVGASGVRLFVNGTQVGVSHTAPSGLPNGGALRLGAGPAHDRPLDGGLDDVRAYAAELTAYQVQADMADAIAEHGPVAAYGFDEGDGALAHDATGRGNDGTLSGATWLADDDHTAVGLDGVTGTLVAGPSDGLVVDGAFTAEVSVKPEGGATSQVLMQQPGRGGADGYTVYASDATGRVTAVIGSTTLSGPVLTAGDWSTIALTDDGAQANLYVNGELASSSAVAAPPHTVGELHVGAAADRLDQHLDGAVDDVRVYRRALDAGEVDEDSGDAVGDDAVVAPEITLGGTLPESPTIHWQDVATLHATAVERDGDSWTPGVTRLSIYLDDELVARTDHGCDPGSCTLQATARIDANAPEWDTEGTTPNPYNDGPHELRVVAVDAAGQVSEEQLPITIDVHYQPPPNSGVYVRTFYGGSGGAITEVSWNPNADADITQYQLDFVDDNTATLDTFPGGPSDQPIENQYAKFSSNLHAGHHYRFYVTSLWNDGGGFTRYPYETPVEATMGSDTVTAPATASATAIDGRVTLTWPQTAVNGEGKEAVDGYLVFREDPDGSPVRLTPEPIAATSFVDVTPDLGSTTTYEIRSVIGHQMSGPTTTAVTTPNGYGADGGTSGGLTEHQDPTVELSGFAATDHTAMTSGRRVLGVTATAAPDATIDRVTIKVDSVTFEILPGCATLRCVVTGNYPIDYAKLSEGHHDVAVRVVDSLGASAVEHISLLTDAGPPPAVQNVGAHPTRDGIKLNWDPVDLRDVSGYQVSRASSIDGTYSVLTNTGTEAMYVDSSAPAAGTVYYEVAAVDDAGNLGPQSDPVAATRAGTVITAPAGLASTPKPYDVHLTWTPVATFDFDHYLVYRADGNGPFKALALHADGASLDDSDVIPGHLYRYKVSAWSTDDEESPLSSSVSAVPSGLNLPGDHSAGTLAYLWKHNTRDVPQANWCNDDPDHPDAYTYCGISDYPQSVSDVSVRARTAGGDSDDVCAGDCVTTNELAVDQGGLAPSVSPDGARVAYVKVDDDNQLIVRIATRSGTDDRQLCGGSDEDGSCLDSWPDTSVLARDCSTPDGCFTLAGITAGALAPAFSADGEDVFYGGNGLYSVSSFGRSAAKKLMDIPAGDAVIDLRPSADGTRIYFDLQHADASSRPMSVAVDGTDLQVVALQPQVAVPDGMDPQYWMVDANTARAERFREVAPSPDGRHLAYVAAGGSFIIVSDADGSDPRIVIKAPAAGLTWTPDGSHLVYLDQTTQEIRSVDVATSDADTLVATDGNERPIAVGGQTGTALPNVSTPDLEGDGRYVKGDGTVSVRVRAMADPGVRAVGLVVAGQHASAEADCTTMCPMTFSAALAFDASEVTEGAHTAQLIAVSPSGAETSIARTLYVDRTQPSAPTDVSVGAGDDDDHRLVTWTAGVDPDLPDGTPGSPVETQLRTQAADGTWSAWQSVSDGAATVPADEEVELRSRDAAGNVSDSEAHSLARRSLSATTASCVIPQPEGWIGGLNFRLNESCDDLKSHGNSFDGDDRDLTGRLTPRLPPNGLDVRKAKKAQEEEEEEECDDEAQDEPDTALIATFGTPEISRREENEEECSYICDDEVVDAVRKSGRDVTKYCRERQWYSVYRMIPKRGAWALDPQDIAYVGITMNWDARQRQHQSTTGAYPVGQYVMQRITDVPFYGVARAVEQALMDVYGFRSVAQNVNLDTRQTITRGLHSRARPTLRNKLNSISPRAKGLYCVLRVFGQLWLDADTPGVPKGNNIVSGTWDANFPKRTCNAAWDDEKNGSEG